MIDMQTESIRKGIFPRSVMNRGSYKRQRIKRIKPKVLSQ